jgi:23S rRNA (cytidine1920-2'-O)/16S rRNA (cytidine1409-2'-O)-methyltransferase
LIPTAFLPRSKIFRTDRLNPVPLKKERADKVLLSRHYAETQQKAQALIMAGLVYSGGRRIEKPGQMIHLEEKISLRAEIPYVSRGGLKLEEALEAFSIDVRGAVAADLGSSTGGFTDCLLQRGARLVYAVDVSASQLDWRLRNDPRVIPIEKNARYLKSEDFAEKPDVVTLDLSFISVLKVLPAIKEFLGDGILLSLLKPQFEVGKGQVGKKGIVRDASQHEAVLNQVLEEVGWLGFGVRGLIKCSIRGQRGNREFFAYLTLAEDHWPRERVRESIKEVAHETKH